MKQYPTDMNFRRCRIILEPLEGPFQPDDVEMTRIVNKFNQWLNRHVQEMHMHIGADVAAQSAPLPATGATE